MRGYSHITRINFDDFMQLGVQNNFATFAHFNSAIDNSLHFLDHNCVESVHFLDHLKRSVKIFSLQLRIALISHRRSDTPL